MNKRNCPVARGNCPRTGQLSTVRFRIRKLGWRGAYQNADDFARSDVVEIQTGDSERTVGKPGSRGANQVGWHHLRRARHSGQNCLESLKWKARGKPLCTQENNWPMAFAGWALESAIW